MQSLTVNVNKKVKEELLPRHAEFSWEYPETVEEAVEKYGQDLTLKLIHDSITLDVQGPARKVLEACDAGWTPEQYSERVGEVMKNHKISVKRSRGPATPKVDPYQAMAQELMSGDTSRRDAIIAKFKSLGVDLTLPAESPESNGVPSEVEETSRRRNR